MRAHAAGVDVGDTFTDLVIVDPNARESRPQAVKVPTTPDDQGEAVAQGLRPWRALRRVSTEQGVDPAEAALVAYGGAGPLHATALARELGIRTIVIPPAPGVLSALGLLLAPPRREVSRTVMAAVTEIPDGTYTGSDLLEAGGDLEVRVTLTVDGEGVTADFAGTAGQVPLNVNAVRAVTLSSAYFVFRVMTDPDAPPTLAATARSRC